MPLPSAFAFVVERAVAPDIDAKVFLGAA